MAKQIYIDSNGNEIPVSGTITNDNNLPHYTGTPTAGTTAEAIASLSSGKQDKIKIKSFTATSDAAGNIEIPDLTVANHTVISCMSSNGYATNAVPSGNKFYFKILTNNNPITPMGSQTTDCYVLYMD